MNLNDIQKIIHDKKEQIIQSYQNERQKVELEEQRRMLLQTKKQNSYYAKKYLELKKEWDVYKLDIEELIDKKILDVCIYDDKLSIYKYNVMEIVNLKRNTMSYMQQLFGSNNFEHDILTYIACLYNNKGFITNEDYDFSTGCHRVIISGWKPIVKTDITKEDDNLYKLVLNNLNRD